MGLLLNQKYIREFPRVQLNSVADKYSIVEPEKVKNKKQLIMAIVEAWYTKFQEDSSFFEEYKKAHEIEITLDQLKRFLEQI